MRLAPGGPSRFTAEQVTQSIAVACEPPEESGRRETHWSPRELADEVVQRGIVDSISRRHVDRFLKGGLRSHKTQYWLTFKDKLQDRAPYEADVRKVCQTYAGRKLVQHPRGTSTQASVLHLA